MAVFAKGKGRLLLLKRNIFNCIVLIFFFLAGVRVLLLMDAVEYGAGLCGWISTEITIQFSYFGESMFVCHLEFGFPFYSLNETHMPALPSFSVTLSALLQHPSNTVQPAAPRH